MVDFKKQILDLPVVTSIIPADMAIVWTDAKMQRISAQDLLKAAHLTTSGGFVVLAKTTSGSGQMSEVVFGANTTLMRNASGNVVAEPINTQTFLEGTTVTKAGYWKSQQYLNVAAAGTSVLDVPLGTAPLGNGSYRFSVSVSASQGANYYDWDYTLRAKRLAGTLSGAGLAAPTADAANDVLPAGITIALTNSSGSLRVTVTNGSANVWHFNVSVALVYTAYPEGD